MKNVRLETVTELERRELGSKRPKVSSCLTITNTIKRARDLTERFAIVNRHGT